MAQRSLRIVGVFSTSLPPTLLLPDLLASHFRTDWLSWLGLGNQVGSIVYHLELLPTQHNKRLKYNEGEADRGNCE